MIIRNNSAQLVILGVKTAVAIHQIVHLVLTLKN